ncbi:hypothetical protein BDA96_01G095200 [Sorghum bicolor]|uniref:Uncharacterized protein n=2 Tax=Sorghum bicolor TaxID=4558 RepID=A0A921RXD1_SORBI|nr:hypothetical protein BDA96_01G095200 [Sorghum bicolor]KXG37561.1 hypothetical protein SORBI_3001G091100 [Sorghum bicolor]
MYFVHLRLLANIYKRCVSFPRSLFICFFEGGRELHHSLVLSFPVAGKPQDEEGRALYMDSPSLFSHASKMPTIARVIY